MEKEIKIDPNSGQDIVYNWRNITEEFKNVSKDLYLGELVHSEMFALFEAMSAIEIMDPKMDAGMLCNRSKNFLSFEKSIEVGLVKIIDFTFEEKIGIVDETYACLATWLEGQSLIQTVFTNLYLHNPSLIKDHFMRKFSYVILKLVDFIRNIITIANVVEEKDLQSDFGYLNCNLMDSKVSSMIKDLEEDLCKKIKGLNKYKDRNFKENNENNLEKNNLENELINEQNIDKKLLDYKYYSALYTRIKITRGFYQYFLNINRQFLEINNSNGKKILSSGLIKIIFTELSKKMEICEENIDDWKSTLDLGIKCQKSEMNESECRNDCLTIMGFSPQINQRFLPPTFPKYTKISSRENSVLFFEKLFFRLKNVVQINKFETFKDCLLFCEDLSSDYNFQFCVCSRSTLQVLNTLQLNLSVDLKGFTEILRNDIYHLVKPVILKDETFLKKESLGKYLDVFFMQCFSPMSKLIHKVSLNRARQREKLKNIFPELLDLFRNANNLDYCISFQKGDCFKYDNFKIWVLYYLVRAMIQYLLLGFELKLYSEHEYCYIYWYLNKNLLKKMIFNLVQIHEVFSDVDGNDNKQKKNKNLNKLKQNKEHSDPLVDEIFIYHGLQFLTDALYKTCKILMKKNIIKQPKIIAENPQILYSQRLAPFMDVIDPIFLNYEKYKEAMDFEDQIFSEKTLELASSFFEQAKNYFSSVSNNVKEIGSLIKIAKTNNIVLKLICNGHKKLEDIRLIFTENKNFPIFKLE